LRFDVITHLRPEPTPRVIEVSTKSGEGQSFTSDDPVLL